MHFWKEKPSIIPILKWSHLEARDNGTLKCPQELIGCRIMFLGMMRKMSRWCLGGFWWFGLLFFVVVEAIVVMVVVCMLFLYCKI